MAVNDDDGESLQGMILLIPLFKTIQFFICACSVATCFGTSETAYTVQRYFLMLLVAAETVCRTAISCFFYLIANGWGVMRFDYDPLQATNCARFLGLAYLCHSAYFVTTGPFSIHLYLRAVLVVFYIYAALKVARATVKQLGVLHAHESFIRMTNMHAQFRPAIQLKRQMLRTNAVLAIIYCFAIIAGLNSHWG